LGELERELGNFSEAELYLKKRLPLIEELGDRRGQCITWGLLGKLYLDQNNLATAEQALSRSLEIGRGSGIDFFLCDYLDSLSQLCLKQGRLPEAKAYARESLAMARAANNKDIIWQSRFHHAQALMADDTGAAKEEMESLSKDAPGENERELLLSLLRQLRKDDEIAPK
jgi:tetratricopeptide (TPR) repeat protein